VKDCFVVLLLVMSSTWGKIASSFHSSQWL